MVIKGIESGYGLGQAFPTTEAKGAAKPANVADEAGGFFKELVNQVNTLQTQADTSIEQFATGEARGLHEVMIAVEKAGISFQFLNQVRNKAVEAYQEVMRMQV
ncbi:MAG TPA: flagellar hook-basal body complex protein FliE [Geobacterales bacterium]|jgi:flagellar hook-basal body complex protein FliE|nr:flagellar hook-basal body complex protein FliE [Geobacterales bacterium]